jgi:hypothetical protein
MTDGRPAARGLIPWQETGKRQANACWDAFDFSNQHHNVHVFRQQMFFIAKGVAVRCALTQAADKGFVLHRNGWAGFSGLFLILLND